MKVRPPSAEQVVVLLGLPQLPPWQVSPLVQAFASEQPAPFSGAGSYHFEGDGSLVLNGVCSGGPDSKLGTGEEICTHRFIPRS